METIKLKFQTVDEYFSKLTPKVRAMMEIIRETVKKAAPDAKEIISYNMPAFRYYGILAYYAAHKEHIGFYPANTLILEIFKNDLIDFETSKGTIKFPYNKEIPYHLIKRIIEYRMSQNLKKSKKVK